MASIIVNHNMAGKTAAEARSTLRSASWKREVVEFQDPELNKLNIPAKSDIALVITELAQQAGKAGGFTIADNTDDYLEQWEKTYAVNKLALKDQWTVDARDTTARYGAPKEWDSFMISVDQAVSDVELATIRDIAKDELSSPAVLASLDAQGNVIPFKGMNGRRAIFISEQHDNTGVRHLHILVNRHAFDMQGKEVAKAVDFSRSGVVQTVMDNIEARIRQAGITHSFGAITAKSQAVTQNTLQMQAQANTNQQIAQAGGQAPGTSAQVGVTVPVSPGKTVVVAAPLTPDAVGMKQQSDVLKSEAERKFREIERLTAEATAAAEAAAKVDQAIQALADNEVLRATLEDTQAKLEEATVKGATLEEVNTDLTEKLEAAETARQIQHEALVDIGTNLSEKAMLGLDVELTEDLARGNVVAIRDIVDILGDQVGTWNEALDQLPEEVATALREDPFKGLNDLVDELLDKRKLTTELTTERDTLKGELETANTLTAELREQLEAKASDLADLEARMAKREEEFAAAMAEQVAKVRAAEAAVLRAEGATQAKQEQLEAEQAKVKELTRTKDAIMNVMTSDDPHATWEQSKDLFKDDIFANRAMGAFLRTASELEQAQQRVTKLEADVVALGAVRQELVAAKATIEEQLGVANDAGVADIRALATEYKKVLANNATLEKQAANLATAAEADQKALDAARQEISVAKQEVATVQQQSAAALQAEQEKATQASAEVERLTAELEQAKAQTAPAVAPEVQQLADYLAANPNMAKALAVIQSNPDWAAVVEEATDNDALRNTFVEITGPGPGLQQVDRTQGAGEDYLGQEPDAKGPKKKNDPDQGNSI